MDMIPVIGIDLIKSENEGGLVLKNYKKNEWMLNNRVYQYSSHVFIQNDKPIQIDSIIMTTTELNETYVKSYLRCVIKSTATDKEIQFKITFVINFIYNIKRVKCDVDRNIFHFQEFSVAIIDLMDVNNQSLEVMNNFQLPNIIHKPFKKLPEVVHCVHYTFDLKVNDAKKIQQWLEIQRNIGIKKIILYTSNIDRLVEHEISRIYDKSFVEIRPYSIHYEAICDPRRLHAYRKIGLEKYQKMKDNCEYAYHKSFSNPHANTTNRWKHQKISSNDCYTTFENVFEFVTYYDFDEIIFPRSKTFDQISFENLSCKSRSFCQYMTEFRKQKLNLYSYLKAIMQKQTNNSENVASIYFENGFYLEPNYYVEKLLNALKDLVRENSTSNTMKKLFLKLSHNDGHYFLIKKEDYNHIKSLYDAYTNISCIHKKLDQSFKRFIFFVTNIEHQLGKSVFYTNNVYAVHTHFPLVYKKDALELKVNKNDGILTHFRNNFYKNANEYSSSIINLKIDAEYYMYAIRNDHKLCL